MPVGVGPKVPLFGAGKKFRLEFVGRTEVPVGVGPKLELPGAEYGGVVELLDMIGGGIELLELIEVEGMLELELEYGPGAIATLEEEELVPELVPTLKLIGGLEIGVLLLSMLELLMLDDEADEDVEMELLGIGVGEGVGMVELPSPTYPGHAATDTHQ